MNSRERVQKVLRREVPDSVPRSLYDVAIDSYNDSTIELFEKRFGKHPRDCFRQDLRGIGLPGPQGTGRPEDKDRIRNWQTVDQVRDVMSRWADSLELDIAAISQQINNIHRFGYPVIAVGSVSDFETPFGMRGREQFFMDLGYQEEWLPVFLDYIADAAAAIAAAAGHAGADIFGIGDDLGSQRGLLISGQLWRTLFKPRLKRIIDAAKNANPEMAFFLHTDGLVTELIPDFIEIGVDILNPIQPEVMEPAEIKRQYGKDLIFFGAISVQYTLPFGTPADVYQEVKTRMETIGADGGYLMTPSHLINADIPWENIVAFFEAADKYGNYPTGR